MQSVSLRRCFFNDVLAVTIKARTGFNDACVEDGSKLNETFF